MYIQVVNFQLEDLSETEYRVHCSQVAPAFAELPGLVSKVWLANREANTYGGVYTWADRRAMEEYRKSELFGAVAANAHLANVTSAGFGVLDEPTRVTNGLAA
jgi:heme-degrading monooxygenase HmoA